MRDVFADVEKWVSGGAAVALATVISTWGSSPRPVGAKMAFTAANDISGSVSGGCVEGAVIAAGQEVLADGVPQLLRFGVADERAWEVGLACGGHIEVWVEQIDPQLLAFARTLIHEERPGVIITLLHGPDELVGRQLAADHQETTAGDLGPYTGAALAAARSLPHAQRLRLDGDVELFVDVLRPAPQLVLVGGVHIAVALVEIATTLGYRTIVVDPRRAFGSEGRFPHVTQLLPQWPEKALAEIRLTTETAVALLSHDPKIDDPALKILLHSEAGYIGALGSRKTHAKRVARLQAMGFDAAAIGRVHAPIGLDIGAVTPAEIALAIMGEIVRGKRGS